jgi:hypothetical protein
METVEPHPVRAREAIAVQIAGGAAFVAMLAAVLRATGGEFSYSLDDAYIHLALSEQIARGHYGLNAGEAASPASSSLWPFLLAPFARAAFHAWLPLAIAGVCFLASLFALERVVDRVVAGVSRGAAAFRVALTLALALGLNLLGLAFNGMEHSLQVLLTLAIVLGLIRWAEGWDRRESQAGAPVPQISRRAGAPVPQPQLSWWSGAAIVIAPLVRYENAALSLAAILYLVWSGRARFALALAGAIAIPVLGFSLFLHRLGLAWLPDSVALKTSIAEYAAAGRGPIAALWMTARFNAVDHPGARLLEFLMLPSAFLAISRATPRAERGLMGVAILALLAHLFAGRFGWFGRYEIYVVAAAVALTLYVGRGALARLRGAAPPVALASLSIGALLLLLLPFVSVTLATPVGAANMHGQGAQMRRFAVEFHRGPVAANDVGRLSYRNEFDVVDLWGLASPEAARARLERRPGWMAEIVRARGVELVMIYDDWYAGQIPGEWRRVGELTTLGRLETAAGATVAFYATSDEAAERVILEMRTFETTLPGSARLAILDD